MADIDETGGGAVDGAGGGGPMAGATLPGPEELLARTRRVLDAHWQPEGYTVPNLHVYPHQWLWDSCFHALIWAHLGVPERAVDELRNVFVHQAADGFVPHMTYWRAPDLHAAFWGRSRTSSITQPPMFGHAIAELVRLGIAVDDDLVASAMAGLDFLLQRRQRDGGVVILHPWESGCDDSPRWDGWCDGPWSPDVWRRRKGELVAALHLDPHTRASVGSDEFEVASSAFEALLVFNARELVGARPDAAGADRVRRHADALAARTGARWDATRLTYRDDGSPRCSGVRTLEALLPVLTEDVVRADGAPAPAPVPARVDAAFAEVTLPTAYGGRCGPTQVHRAEPVYAPDRYWRGGAWPQLSYLTWVAARRAGRGDVAAALCETTVRGAVTSGFAEHWHPDSGQGLGAVPQSWTGLAAVMAAVTATG